MNLSEIFKLYISRDDNDEINFDICYIDQGFEWIIKEIEKERYQLILSKKMDHIDYRPDYGLPGKNG